MHSRGTMMGAENKIWLWQKHFFWSQEGFNVTAIEKFNMSFWECFSATLDILSLMGFSHLNPLLRVIWKRGNGYRLLFYGRDRKLFNFDEKHCHNKEVFSLNEFWPYDNNQKNCWKKSFLCCRKKLKRKFRCAFPSHWLHFVGTL